MLGKRHCSGVSFLLLVAFLGGPAPGGDWPMWRYSSNRGAETPDAPPRELHLQWTRQLPALEPAWPTEPESQFDLGYEPVVMGKTMFIGSSRNDSVVALDTDTGTEKWRFYTDGPVRFAPVAWRGKVYVASDDGFLYCLDAESGQERWKFQGGPLNRKCIGNERLISVWHVRGGAVLADGTIYFAAGTWPFMGVFIHALDAETGKVVWTNSGANAMYKSQYVSGGKPRPYFIGVTPQGYLVAAGDKLLVPCGRTKPACFDRRTGKFLYYHEGDRNEAPTSFVVAMGKYFFCSYRWMFEIDTSQKISMLGFPPVGNDERIYVTRYGGIAGWDISSPPKVEEYKNPKGEKRTKRSFPKLNVSGGAANRVWIKAGNRLYASAKSTVLA